MVQQLINGIAHEVNFWRGFVETDRFRKGWASDTPNPELHQYASDVLKRQGGVALDVGSGPVSILRGTVPAADIVAADPLAIFYEGLVDYKALKIAPPEAVRAEDLLRHFGSCRFSIVHCSNALDHCQDPFSAISQMKGLLIKGGLLFIQGFENEAYNEKWAGLHQWNIRAQGGEGIVISGWHGSNETFVPGEVKTIELPSEKTWFYYEYRL